MSDQTTFFEAWLLEQILERFDSYYRRPTRELLDEFYILVATLKIAGFETAHIAMRSRLQHFRATEAPSVPVARTPAPKKQKTLRPVTSTRMHG
ncbi:hypothetical protein BH11ACT4_BH11ACT4_13050 [soil metagenome]